MRNLILSMIFLGLAGYGAKVVYDRFVYNEGNLFERTYVYPATITVENKEGSKIQITLLGRSQKYVKFKKESGREFVYSISSLNEKSQAIIMKYPENGVGDVSSYLSSGDMKLEDVYVTQLEEEIRKMDDEKSRLMAKAKGTKSKTELRTIERKIEDLDREITELRDTIANR